jgi:hypothetical protein
VVSHRQSYVSMRTQGTLATENQQLPQTPQRTSTAQKNFKRRQTTEFLMSEPRNDTEPLEQTPTQVVSPRPHTNHMSQRFMMNRTKKRQTFPTASKSYSKTFHPQRSSTRKPGGTGQSLSGWSNRQLGVGARPTESQQAINRRRNQLNMELMKILEQESTAETIREMQLRQTADEKERVRLEKIFGVERAKASERIVATSEKHD